MKQSLINRTIRERIVDTTKYRYVAKDMCDDKEAWLEIWRLPLDLLDTTGAIDGWETVYDNREHDMMETTSPEERIYMVFDRTLDNCKYLERVGHTQCLLNEIGCLRGVMYAAEEVLGFLIDDTDEVKRFLKIQCDMRSDEEPFRKRKPRETSTTTQEEGSNHHEEV